MTNSKISFHPIISDWFAATFKKPSPPQIQGWPQIIKGKHTLIFAPTGSGKTLAAFMWCINDLFQMGLQSDANIFEQNPNGVHTLYISPLKALNNDIQRNLEVPLKGIEEFAQKNKIQNPAIHTLVRTGDTPQPVRQKMVKQPPHILITTPESLYLLITSFQGREIFRNLKYLIVDEIHSMLTNKRGVHLSLSIERLMFLCKQEPVRIGLSATQKPLERVADFLGGQVNNQNRNVTIVDCGKKKQMDLKVISAVPTYEEIPEDSVWPAVHLKLYNLIQEHKTTLVFVNMRAQTEKIARRLNEMYRDKSGNEDAEIAFAHHGSMSRETRFEIEEKLKNGEIPAVIATASLELGIDIGSIDLVVNLQSPSSVSSGLQRVGRSGHLLSAKSKGRIIPLFQSDLDDSLAIAKAMKDGDIEEAQIPENCLDVLSQQILAEVSMQSWNRKKLYQLFCQSYCYRFLSEMVFNQVLEMLSGKYAESKLPSLQSRLTWDKVNDSLIARKGSRLTAVINGGTIPDRGYYSVYLKDKNVRLGEMEEEFVFESKLGDIFFLGNNEWRIDSIKQDRIEVTPMTDLKPRAPFWKGEIPFRDFQTCQIIGKFHEDLANKINSNTSLDWLSKEYFADPVISKSIIAYYSKQKSLSDTVPANKNVVVEIFRDTAEELNVIFHTTFGARVNAPWAIVLAAQLEKRLNCEVQYSFDDNGFLIRFLETVEDPPWNTLMRLSGDEVKKDLIQSLAASPLFAIQFRYNAARALLLPRSQPGKRIPLWLQRLRAADLLQAVQKYPDFPIVAETYRTCLQDIFDLPSLLQVIDQINNQSIKINFVTTPYPSPMAAGLIFNFTASQVYEQDRSRIAGDAASISNKFLVDILKKDTIPAIVSQSMVEEKNQYWEFLSQDKKASNAEDLFEIIEKLGPINEEQLQIRSKSDPTNWLKFLDSNNRIQKLSGTFSGWIVTTQAQYFENPDTYENAKFLVRNYLQNHGPFYLQEITAKYQISENLAKQILTEFKDRELCVFGKLIKDSPEELWCDRNNFCELYRSAIGSQRKSVVAVPRNNYYKFLLKWHGFNSTMLSIEDIIQKYKGYHFAEYIFEREILRSRLGTHRFTEFCSELEQLMAHGEVITNIFKNGNRDFLFFGRGEGNLFQQSISVPKNSTKQEQIIYTFIKENGASFISDIVEGSQLSFPQIHQGLKSLLDAGVISCDNYTAIKSLLQPFNQSNKLSDGLLPKSSSRRKPSRSALKSRVSENIEIKRGRWFLNESFAVQGKTLTEKERIEKQTRLLLLRYGILVKEMYRYEKGLLPWYPIFQCLKQLEWQGEIRRGYFIEGLSGIQFALPQAVEMLENIHTQPENNQNINMICVTDPALPFGRQIEWGLFDSENNAIPVTRVDSNHIIFYDSTPLLYCENFATRLWFLKDYKIDTLETIIDVLKDWLRLPQYLRPRKKIEIQQINAEPAIKYKNYEAFLKHGFEQNNTCLELWPSGF